MPDNQYWRDASGRLTFEMFRVPANRYTEITTAIAATFRLIPDGMLVSDGFDVLFQDYRRDEQVIGLEWDNWTGYTVVAKTRNAEPLVQEIAAWLLHKDWMAGG